MNYMINRPLSDMETDGVYFNEDNRIITEPVKKQVDLPIEEDEICHYSGLPSTSFYEKISNQEVK